MQFQEILCPDAVYAVNKSTMTRLIYAISATALYANTVIRLTDTIANAAESYITSTKLSSVQNYAKNLSHLAICVI